MYYYKANQIGTYNQEGLDRVWDKYKYTRRQTNTHELSNLFKVSEAALKWVHRLAIYLESILLPHSDSQQVSYCLSWLKKKTFKIVYKHIKNSVDTLSADSRGLER